MRKAGPAAVPGSALQASGREGVLGERQYATLNECMYVCP